MKLDKLKTTNDNFDSESFEGDYLKQMFESHNEVQEPYDKLSIWASQSLCPRKSYLDIVAPPQIRTSNVILELAAEMGNAAEQVMLKRFTRGGIMVRSDVKLVAFGPDDLFNQYRIGGKIDCIVKDENGKLCIVDGKTHGTAYNTYSKRWHEQQVKIYCALTGIHNGRIFGMSRLLSDGRKALNQTHIVDTSTKSLIAAVQKYVYALMCIEEGLTPNTMGTIKSLCSYCDHKDRCWNSTEFALSEADKRHEDILQRADVIAKTLVLTGTLERLETDGGRI